MTGEFRTSGALKKGLIGRGSAGMWGWNERRGGSDSFRKERMVCCPKKGSVK